MDTPSEEIVEAYTAAGSAVKGGRRQNASTRTVPRPTCGLCTMTAYNDSVLRLRALIGPDEPSHSQRHFVGGLEKPPRPCHVATTGPGLGAHLFHGTLPWRRGRSSRAGILGSSQRRSRRHPQRESPRVDHHRFRGAGPGSGYGSGLRHSDGRANGVPPQRLRRARHRRFHSAPTGKGANHPAGHRHRAHPGDGRDRHCARGSDARTDAARAGGKRPGIRRPRTNDRARRPGNNYLHLRHDRNFEGSDAHSREHGVECRLLHGGLRLWDEGRSERIVSPAFPCDGAARGFRAALPRRGAGVLFRPGATCEGLDGIAARHIYLIVALEVEREMLIAVPRFYEKIGEQVIVKTAGFPRNAVYRWALSVGRAHRAEILAGTRPRALSWKLADRLVFSKVRAGMGGKAEEFISGGAPLGRELAEWYADIGVHTDERYGLTETSPVIAVNTPKAHKLGTVGKPLANVEVRIADDGEVLVRGPSVFKGYWNRPEDTRNAFVDGWFKTGDIGYLDREGYLSITDRKKNLIKTSGGKFIAPQPIESSLKLNPLIGTAVVVGDRRKFPAVLISPHFPLLEEWARANQVEFTSRQTLVANPKVQALYEGLIEDLNQNLARFEKLKRVIVVPEEFSAADGTMTHTFKVRRRDIEERYRTLIDEMYAKADVAPG